MSGERLVLIVDDDYDVREVITLVLESFGYEVETAANGVEALERLARPPLPSLILVDMMMPVMDGVELIEHLHEEPTTASIPVVVLSGDRAAAGHGSELGVSGCLAKPVELDDLLATAHRFAEAEPRPEV